MKKMLLVLILLLLSASQTITKDVDYTKYTAFRFGMTIKQVQKICIDSNYTVDYNRGNGVGWWSVAGKLPKFLNISVSQSRLYFTNKKLRYIAYLSARDSLVKMEKELISNFELDIYPTHEWVGSFFNLSKKIFLILSYDNNLPDWDGEYFGLGKN